MKKTDNKMKRNKVMPGGKAHNSETRSFTGRVWRIASIFIALILLFLSVNMGARYVINGQMKNSVESIADSYVKEITYKFSGANDYLTNLVVADADVESANYSYGNNNLSFIQSSQKVNEKLNSYQYAMGNQFHFLIYYETHEYFNESERGALTIREVDNLKVRLRAYMEAESAKDHSITGSVWKILRINEKWYAMNYSYYNKVYACCFVELGDLEKLIDRIDIGKNNYMAFASADGKLYTHEDDAEADRVLERAKSGDSISSLFGYSNSVISRAIPKADLNFFLVMEREESMTLGMIMQWILLMIMFVGVIFIIWMSYYVRKELLHPLQYFFENLDRIAEDEENAYFENSEIQELQQANDLYRKILDQAHQLKIEVYEKTEEQQRLQIEYMQLQIQPHFYINCMNMIHNMSCMGDEEGVQMMAAHVSDYFRYIFGINAETVDLAAELKHIENYLEICKIRYRMKVDYQIEADDDLSGIRIPPLLLHTCVENSVKYGCRQGEVSIIRILIRKSITETGEEYVEIEVMDDGPGFETEILEHLAKKEEIVTDRGTRVGILNVIKRMDHIYGENYRIAFSNRESGGARIWFKIPVIVENKV